MAARFSSYLKNSALKIHILQRFTYCTQAKTGRTFNTSVLDILVCPLSKEPLRRMLSKFVDACISLDKTARVACRAHPVDQFFIKKAKRYDEENHELVNDKLNVAYPIQDGIPNMNPNNARKIDTKEEQ